MIELIIKADDVVGLAHEIYKHYRHCVDMGWAPDEEVVETTYVVRERTTVAEIIDPESRAAPKEPQPTPRKRRTPAQIDEDRKVAEAAATRLKEPSPEEQEAQLAAGSPAQPVVVETPTPLAEPAEEPVKAGTTTEEPVTATFDDVKAALRRVVDVQGFDGSVLAVAALGVEKLKQLSADRYAEAIASFEAVVAKAEAAAA